MIFIKSSKHYQATKKRTAWEMLDQRFTTRYAHKQELKLRLDQYSKTYFELLGKLLDHGSDSSAWASRKLPWGTYCLDLHKGEPL